MTVSVTGPRGVNCTCFSQVMPGSSSTGAACAGTTISARTEPAATRRRKRRSMTLIEASAPARGQPRDDPHVRLLVALAVVTALAGAGAARPATPVPILVFHVVGDPPPGAPFPELYVSVADFRAEMAWLARHGYHPVTMNALWRHWDRGAPLPAKPVALTFDDGYPQDVDVVMPILRARRWRATLNLHVGNLIPARVRLLIAAGWEIDAHTFTHRDLTTLGPRELRREVTGSRRWIQRVFGQPARFFAYPAGRYDLAVVDAVRQAGYYGAETERPVLAVPDDRFTLGRFEIVRDDGVAGMATKLS